MAPLLTLASLVQLEFNPKMLCPPLLLDQIALELRRVARLLSSGAIANLDKDEELLKNFVKNSLGLLNLRDAEVDDKVPFSKKACARYASTLMTTSTSTTDIVLNRLRPVSNLDDVLPSSDVLRELLALEVAWMGRVVGKGARQTRLLGVIHEIVRSYATTELGREHAAFLLVGTVCTGIESDAGKVFELLFEKKLCLAGGESTSTASLLVTVKSSCILATASGVVTGVGIKCLGTVASVIGVLADRLKAASTIDLGALEFDTGECTEALAVACAMAANAVRAFQQGGATCVEIMNLFWRPLKSAGVLLLQSVDPARVGVHRVCLSCIMACLGNCLESCAEVLDKVEEGRGGETNNAGAAGVDDSYSFLDDLDVDKIALQQKVGSMGGVRDWFELVKSMLSNSKPSSKYAVYNKNMYKISNAGSVLVCDCVSRVVEVMVLLISLQDGRVDFERDLKGMLEAADVTHLEADRAYLEKVKREL